MIVATKPNAAAPSSIELTAETDADRTALRKLAYAFGAGRLVGAVSIVAGGSEISMKGRLLALLESVDEVFAIDDLSTVTQISPHTCRGLVSVLVSQGEVVRTGLGGYRAASWPESSLTTAKERHAHRTKPKPSTPYGHYGRRVRGRKKKD